MWEFTIGDLFAKAGLTRWPLLVCSVVALGIILERSFYFFSISCNYEKFKTQLFTLLKNKKLNEAINFATSLKHPVAILTGVYLINRNSAKRQEILSREGSFLMEKVESRLRGLEAIVHIAPLLGLLGTVAGLVLSFHEIQSVGGQVQAENLAGGIWEALLSTVFGLIVAIPCVAVYHSFESVTDRIARRLTFIVSELDEFFNQES